MAEVALSLSGGGYRAAMFHLGTLSYLSHLGLADGRCFLDIVNTISTISGGTITGLWYMMSICQGKNINDSINQLYQILVNYDLPDNVIKEFLRKDNSNDSLIREMVAFYDKIFFHNATFGMIMEEADNGHIHHFSANGTDFSNGYAFRFQASKRIASTPDYPYGVIGNNKHKIDRNLAKEIKLSEILAVSSCFPGGFEPMVFPGDFAFSSDKKLNTLYKGVPFRLMDGGIVDNQGIEPLLLASKQMTYDNPNAKSGDDHYASHDLIIVSDVSSANPQRQENVGENIIKSNWIGNFTINKINGGLNLAIVVFALGAIISCISDQKVLLGISIAFESISLFLRFCMSRVKYFFLKQVKSLPFDLPWKKYISNVNLSKIYSMLSRRVISLMDLASFVFMKPIRQMRYNQLYSAPEWKNRLISNIISETSSRGSWKWKKELLDDLIPSEGMKQNSDTACSMATTLWFTKADKEKGVPNALFSCGQYTICWNLLEYINKLKKDKSNTNSNHNLIIGCEVQLMDDWEKFLTDPQWLMKEQKLI